MDALFAKGRAPQIPESEDLYGWLVGGWDLDDLHGRRETGSRAM